MSAPDGSGDRKSSRGKGPLSGPFFLTLQQALFITNADCNGSRNSPLIVNLAHIYDMPN